MRANEDWSFRDIWQPGLQRLNAIINSSIAAFAAPFTRYRLYGLRQGSPPQQCALATSNLEDPGKRPRSYESGSTKEGADTENKCDTAVCDAQSPRKRMRKNDEALLSRHQASCQENQAGTSGSQPPSLFPAFNLPQSRRKNPLARPTHHAALRPVLSIPQFPPSPKTFKTPKAPNTVETLPDEQSLPVPSICPAPVTFDSKTVLSCVYPSDGRLGCLHLTQHDLRTLEPTTYVNDTVMDYFIKNLESKLSGRSNRCLFFNSFFHKKLTEAGPGVSQLHTVSDILQDDFALNNWRRVHKWTKKHDVFTADYIIIPIHAGLHWSLAVIAFPAALHNTPNKPHCANTDPQVIDISGEDDHGVMCRHWSAGVRGDESACRQSDSHAHGSTQQTFVMHFDPLPGSAHCTASITRALLEWLHLEWMHRRAEGTHLVRDKAADTGTPHYRDTTTRPSSRQSASSTHATQLSARVDWECGVLIESVPQQSNSYDCGPFVLVYMDYFTACPPSRISRNKANASHLQCTFPCPIRDTQWAQHFLTPAWFPTSNPSALRRRLKRDILLRMIQHDRLEPRAMTSCLLMQAEAQIRMLQRQDEESPHLVYRTPHVGETLFNSYHERDGIDGRLDVTCL